MIINEKYITDIDDEDDDNVIDSNSFNYTNNNNNDDFDDKLILCFSQDRNAFTNTNYQKTIDSIHKINDLIIDILDDFDMFTYSEDFEYYTSHTNFQYCPNEIKIDDRLVIHTQTKDYYGVNKDLAVVVHMNWDIKRPTQVFRFCSYLFKRFTHGIDVWNSFVFESFYPQSKKGNSWNISPFTTSMNDAISSYHHSKTNANKFDLSIIKNFYTLCAIFAKSTKIIPQCRKILNFNGLPLIKQQIIPTKTSKNVFEGHSLLDNIDVVLDYVYLDVEDALPKIYRSMDGYDDGVLCSLSKEYVKNWAVENNVGMNIGVYRSNKTYYAIYMFDKPFESYDMVDIVFVIKLDNNMIWSDAYDINISDFCTPLVAACGTYGKVLDTIDKEERSLPLYVSESIDEQINYNISKYDNK